MLQDELQNLKDQGVTASTRGNTLVIHLPSWRLYKRARKYKKHLAAIALVKQVFSVAPPIRDMQHQDKCGVCRFYAGYKCSLTADDERMTPEALRNGCERWEQSAGIHF